MDCTAITTRKNFIGELGVCYFTSVIKFNNNTKEYSLANSYSKGYPVSGYKYSVTNGSAGTVTFKSGKIYITWN